MPELIDPHPPAPWSMRMRCTGEGNRHNQPEIEPCGALLAIIEGDVFNSNTIARPFPSIRSPQCGAVTDLNTTGIDSGRYQALREMVRYW